MSPNYVVLSFDLATARTKATIVEVGTQVDSVTVLQMPAAAVASLAFAQNKDLIPLAAGYSFQLAVLDENGCPHPSEDGVYLANPAGAGTVVLLISYGGIAVQGAV